jgi:hypothetical protein
VSTGLIIAIVVAALILLVLLVLLPRMRASAQTNKAERELHSRRETVADEHRTAASERERQAELAERKARIAQQEAERDRAEAGLQAERASMHEQGLADHELIEDHERDRFADVANTGPAGDRDGDGHTVDDRARSALDRDAVDDQGAVSPEYQRGREDERRSEGH